VAVPTGAIAENTLVVTTNLDKKLVGADGNRSRSGGRIHRPIYS